MTTATAYPAAMADLREDPAHSSLWSSYGPISGRVGNALPSDLPNPSTSPHPGRPRSNQETVDHSYPYSRYSHEEPDHYDRHAHPSLTSHHSFPNLKRSYSQTEPSSYQEIVQDLRDDGSKLTVNNDHKLLAFKRSQDKHAIVDQQGRMQQLELSAQLHGMFFLSEMPSNTGDGGILQPELTCYRRNLFQISGSLITPRGQLSVITETGETVGVSNMEVTISAIESVDGNPVRLIVIPWKTPPPNSPEINQTPDQEPPSLPLIPFQDETGESDGEYAVYPIGWRRLQFRVATANNGRRKELQQHFVLHLKVVATLANGSVTVLTESTTAPIVVRGRSPRNFQARKEIPLLGSSAGSRGQALVETGMGVVAGALAVKPQDPKQRPTDGQLPRTAFTFNAPKLPGSQLGPMRSSSYLAWNSPVPSSGPPSYPPTSMGTDPYSKVSLPGAPSFGSEPSELPMQTSMPPPMPMSLVGNDHQPPLRSQYTYVQSTTAPPPLSLNTSAISGPEHALSIPRYVDHPRPAKSPRHASQTSVQSSEASPEYRYGPYAGSNDVSQPTYSTETSAPPPPPPRDYYPSVSTWTTTAGEHSSTTAYASHDHRSYSFSHESYKGAPTGTPPVKADSSHPPPTSVYNGAPRSSFESLNNYSWSTN